MTNILWFEKLTAKDVSTVGGKNASLGEMYNYLRPKGVPIPNGFAITTDSYRDFLKVNRLEEQIATILRGINTNDLTSLQDRGQKIRNLIKSSSIPENIANEVRSAYRKLSTGFSSRATDVAVRSSATAEDLPEASFAGQQATFLNIVGEEPLLEAVKNCFASLFTDRAISYRAERGLSNTSQIFLSVGVQKMIRADKASAGVVFTLHPETGFPGVVVVNSSWGLGELVVQGEVTPDEFQIFKEGIRKGFPAIIARDLGSKEKTLVYDEGGSSTKIIPTGEEKRRTFSLRDDEVLRLSNWALQIADYFQKPMDIEWAKDGLSDELFIVQARPETVHSKKKSGVDRYIMHKGGELLVKGAAVGTKIVEGKARVIQNPSQIKTFAPGEILVTSMTEPDWEPLLKIASAIVTDEGGRISHASILAQELGIPAVVATHEATKKILPGELLTIDCSQGNDGFVWRGKADWEVKNYSTENLERPKTKVMLNISSPFEAYESYFLPNDGVGLVRQEFIIASRLKIHPLALVNFEKLTDTALKTRIEKLTVGYKDKKDYYIQKLASDLAQVAAAFYPKEVVVRFSDFKTNEYAGLIAGNYFEPREENPLIGWRGAARYTDPRFFEAFALECRAIKIAREVWGLGNIVLAIPFCRSVSESERVFETMAKFGLQKGGGGLKIYLVAELPSNVDQAEKFCSLFDGFVVDLNSLSELTVGVVLEEVKLEEGFEALSQEISALVQRLTQAAKKNGIFISLFGDRFTREEKFVESAVKFGVGALSVNPDLIVKTTLTVLEMEKNLALEKSPS